MTSSRHPSGRLPRSADSSRAALRRRILDCYGEESRILAIEHAPEFAGSLFVVDLTRGARLLRILGSVGHGGRMAEQSALDLMRPERLVYPYERLMLLAFALARPPQAALLLGLGGGDMLRHLQAYLPGCSVTAVERDARIIDLARRHFHLVAPVTRGGAEEAVTEASGAYDVVLVDLYDGRGAASVEPGFWADCAAALKPGGCLAVNWADFVGAAAVRQEAALIARTFGRSLFVTPRRTRENVIQLAPTDPAFEPSLLAARWRRFALEHRLPRDDRDILERAAATAELPGVER